MTGLRCAVLGSPIAHSLSPAIHRAAYADLGLDWSYEAFDVDADALPGFIADCGPEWVGLSCTMPLKEALLSLGEPGALASALGVGNTYLFARDGGRARVENTDVAGMVVPLREAGVDAVARVAILGAGATARSAIAAAAELGADQVVIFARDVERARASLDRLPAALRSRVEIAELSTAGQWPVDLTISTLPAGAAPQVAEQLAARAAAILDVNYGHGTSALVASARSAGKPAVDGLQMLVAQAGEQVALMTGRRVSGEVLRAAARAELLRRAG